MMAQLECLNSFLTERLVAAAGEIFQVIKDTISEYQDEIDRAKRENRYLRGLLESINSSGEELKDIQTSPCHTDESQIYQKPVDSEPVVQVKLELCTVQQELGPQQPHTTVPMDTSLNQEPPPCLPVKSMDAEEKECNSLHVDPVPVKTELCDFQATCTDSSDMPSAQREQESANYFEVDEKDLNSVSCLGLFSGLPDQPLHTQSNLADRLFYCKICNKPFKSSLWLEKHMASHNNEERHVCGVCGKRFKHPQTLESHINNHTRERPFCCRFCGKSFSQKSHVKDHERIHTGEKPFICPICQKCFVQRSQLMTHIHTHSYMMKDLSEVKQRKR